MVLPKAANKGTNPMPPVHGRDHAIDMQIGLRLRLLRVDRGLSQEALGAAIGVTFQQVQKYETGSNAIASTRIPLLCRALRIVPNDLFDGLDFEGEPVPIGAIAMGLAARIGKLIPKKRQVLAKLLDLLEGDP
jgi:transcriptional regulator with XRE-family HTH domain